MQYKAAMQGGQAMNQFNLAAHAGTALKTGLKCSGTVIFQYF
jgi:hypothetical protein